MRPRVNFTQQARPSAAEDLHERNTNYLSRIQTSEPLRLKHSPDHSRGHEILPQAVKFFRDKYRAKRTPLKRILPSHHVDVNSSAELMIPSRRWALPQMVRNEMKRMSKRSMSELAYLGQARIEINTPRKVLWSLLATSGPAVVPLPLRISP